MKNRKKKFKSSILDFFVICFCLFVCYYSVSLFLDEYFSNTIRSDKQVIAEVDFKYNVAQRKFDDRVVWERIQQSTLIYDADTIRVAKNSTASIKVGESEETKINLYENTMIQFFLEKDGALSISMDSGSLDVSTGELDSGLKIKLANNTVVKLKPGSKIEAKSEYEISDIKVYEGSASVISNDGEEILIPKNQSVIINQNGKSRVNPVTVTSVPSVLNLLHFENSKPQINFDFQISEQYKNESIVLEFSPLSDFSNIINTYESKNGQEIKALIEQRKIYWRAYLKVFTKDNISIQQNSSSGSINVIEVPELKLLSPENTKISSFNKESEVNFNWKGNEYASFYKVEVSKQKDFSSILLSEITENDSIKLTFQEGNYYWRVVPFYSIQNIGFRVSDVYSSFEVLKKEPLSFPVLSYPINGLVIESQKQNTVLPFVWKSDIKDSSYKLIVSNNKDFSSSEFIYDTNENSVSKIINSELIKDGVYYWKVVRTSKNDGLAYESEIGTFEVKKKEKTDTRLVYPPENYSVESKRFYKTKFMWVLSNEYSNEKEITSILQISPTEDFRKMTLESSINKTEINDLSIPEGNYYWRVGIKTKNLDSPIEYTSPRKINVCSVLKSPEFISPKNNDTIVVTQNRQVELKVSNIPQAGYYKVSFINSDTNKEIISQTIENQNLKETIDLIFTLPDSEKLSNKETSYICKIQSFKDSSNFNDYLESEVNILTVKIKLKEEKPKEKPKVQNKKAERKIEESKKEENLNKAEKEQKKEIEKPVEKEVVLEVTKLDSPVLISPQNDFVIDVEYLKNNRTISFEWNKVNNATDYSFELYYKTNDGKLKKVYSQDYIKNLSIVISDLSILDVGEFEWHLTAYNHENNKIKQISVEAVQKFVVDIQLPQKVITKDPGKLYGE